MNEWISTVTIILLLAQPSLVLTCSLQSTSSVSAELTLCELMRHSDQYDGKVVTVGTTLGSSMEGSIFFNDTCKSSISEPDVISNVTFNEEFNFETPLYKKLRKLLKKSGETQVTVVGLFVDGKGREFGHMACETGISNVENTSFFLLSHRSSSNLYFALDCTSVSQLTCSSAGRGQFLWCRNRCSRFGF